MPATGVVAISAMTPSEYHFPKPCTPNKLIVLQPFRSNATCVSPSRPMIPNCGCARLLPVRWALRWATGDRGQLPWQAQ